MTPTSDLEALIERLRPLAEAATTGPWVTEKFGDAHDHDKWGTLYKLIADPDEEDTYEIGQVWSGQPGNAANDAAYIAAFNPQVMLQLLDALSAALRVTEPFAKTADQFKDNDSDLDYAGPSLIPQKQPLVGHFRNIAHWRQTGKERI